MTLASVSQQSLPQKAAGLGELAFYAFVLFMATGPLDHMIQEKMVSSALRAAIWAGLYAGFFYLMVARAGLMIEAVTGAWPLLLLPALALASTAWSIHPEQTIVGTLETAAVVFFGAIVGTRLNERQLLRLIVLMLMILAVINIGVTYATPFGRDVNDDAIGIFNHKNQTGSMMTVLVIASLAILVWGRAPLLGLAALVVALPLLGLSGSRTSWLASLVGGATILALLVRRLAPSARLALGLLSLGLACALAVLWMSTRADVVGDILLLLGRDTTLTGRTVLWDLAARYIEQAPFLGHGFDAFWSEDPVSGSAFVNRVLKQELQSFHNGYIDMAVELGWLGAALQVAILAAFVAPWRRLLKYGDAAAAAFASAFLVVVVVDSLSEVTLYIRHGFHLLLLASLWARAGVVAREAEGAVTPRIVARPVAAPRWQEIEG